MKDIANTHCKNTSLTDQIMASMYPDTLIGEKIFSTAYCRPDRQGLNCMLHTRTHFPSIFSISFLTQAVAQPSEAILGARCQGPAPAQRQPV